MKKLIYPLLMASSTSIALAASPAPVDFHDHLGLQTYSLREMIKTNLPGALDLIKSYGVTEIEGAGYPSVPVPEYVALIKARGLDLVSAHFSYEGLTKNIDGAVANAKEMGLKYAMVPWIPHDESGLTAAEAHKAAADFNTWGKAFAAAGIRFGYHPHGYEFLPYATEDGKNAFDILVGETEPAFVCLEMDVFWIYHAEQDPVKLLKAYPDRWVLMHLKDMRKGAARDVLHGSRALATDNVTVGDGQIDWKAVLTTAQEIGVQHYFIEDETPDPLTCIPASLTYLRGLKL